MCVIFVFNIFYDIVLMMYVCVLMFMCVVGGDCCVMCVEYKKSVVGWICVVMCVFGEDDEIVLFEKVLKMVKMCKVNGEVSVVLVVFVVGGVYSGLLFNVKTFNAILSVGLNKFLKGKYVVSGDDKELLGDLMVMMLWLYKL